MSLGLEGNAANEQIIVIRSFASADVRGEHPDRRQSVQGDQGAVRGVDHQEVQWQIAGRTGAARLRYR